MYRRLICLGTLGTAIALSACTPSKSPIETADNIVTSSVQPVAQVRAQATEQTAPSPKPDTSTIEEVAEIEPVKKIVTDTKWLKGYETEGYKTIFSSTDKRIGMLLAANSSDPRFIVKMGGNTMELNDCSEDLINPRPTKVGGYKVAHASSYVCPSNMMEIDIGYRDGHDRAIVQVKDVMSQEKLVSSYILEGR